MIVDNCVSEFLVDLQHVSDDLAVANLNLSSLNELLDLVVVEFIQSVFKVLVELLSECLSACFVLWLDSILEVVVLVLLILDLLAVELIHHVPLYNLVAS